MIASLERADDGLAIAVPANSTDLALLKSDVKPDAKLPRKERADMVRGSNPWSNADCTAVKESRNGWNQGTKSAFAAALFKC